MTETKPNRAPFALAAGGIALAILLDVALGTPGKNPDAISFLGRFHPLAVHLPIGIILLLALLEGLSVSKSIRAKVDPALSTVIAFALATAIAAFAMGLMLAHGGGYPAKLLRLHRLLTLATVIGTAACVLAWTMVTQRGVSRLFYRGSVGITVLLLSIGAHFGGSMTHGENYLVQFAPSFMKGLVGSTDQAAQDTPPPAPTVASDPKVFSDVVMPILKDKCFECHGAEKSKVGLRVDSLEAIMKGGDDGAAVVAGHSEKSLLVTRIQKPTTEDEHMPPADKPQITAEELDLIQFWIDRGASPDLKVRDVLVPDGARGLLLKASAGISTHGDSSTATTTTKPTSTATVDPSPNPTTTTVATTTSGVPVTTANDGLAFRDLIAPTLANKCGRCHGAEKQKGKLRTDSLGALLTGGKTGAAVVPNDPTRGTLMTRIHLAASDDKHMPPIDEPQLNSSETELLSFWIAHGADADLKTSAVPASIRHVAPIVKRNPDPNPYPNPSQSQSPNPSQSPSPSPSPSAAPVPVVHPVRLFTDVVQPIFKSRCGSCHAGEFAAGDFVIADHDALFAKSRIVAGDSSASKLFAQISSPLSDDDHMPPKKKPQPTQDEVDAVRLWIARGAKEDAVVDASEVSPQLLGSIAQHGATSHDETQNPADKAKLAQVQHGGCGSCTVTGSDDWNASAVGVSALVLGLFASRRKRSKGTARSQKQSV